MLPELGQGAPEYASPDPMNRSIIALAATLTAGPAFAESPDYPPDLFENSPVVPSGPLNVAPSDPPDAPVPSGPLDADIPFGSPHGGGPSGDFCAGVEFRTFRSLAEVRQAHAGCDPEAH
jgi:hypothetical protein